MAVASKLGMMVPETEMISLLIGFERRPRDTPFLTIIATSDAMLRVGLQDSQGPSGWLATSRVAELSNRIAVAPWVAELYTFLGLNYFATIFE